MSSRTPYFEVLDQNRWTGTCIADTLRNYSNPGSRRASVYFEGARSPPHSVQRRTPRWGRRCSPALLRVHDGLLQALLVERAASCQVGAAGLELCRWSTLPNGVSSGPGSVTTCKHAGTRYRAATVRERIPRLCHEIPSSVSTHLSRSVHGIFCSTAQRLIWSAGWYMAAPAGADRDATACQTDRAPSHHRRVSQGRGGSLNG